MSRFFLLVIVAVTLLFLAPKVGASRSIFIDPEQQSSPLLTRTFIDVINEGEVDGEDIIDHREENREDGKLEERRNDAREFAEDHE
jgi:hypothetical protein